MKNNVFKYKQDGAAAIVASIIITAGMLSIVLSILLTSINMREGMASFSDSVQSFYTAESGVGEALVQLRMQHDNFTFNDIVVGGMTANSEFVDESGECQALPECQFAEGSGWWGEYFDYPNDHPDMEIGPPYAPPTPTPTEHDWYDDIYKTHEQIDAHLIFGPSLDTWFPYDGTVWALPSELINGHDYFFGAHWRARVTAPSSGYYSFVLRSDDDSWLLVGGIVIVNNSGCHDAFSKTGSIYLSAGDNIVELYFAERHTTDSGFNFNFDNTSLVITPWPEGCGDALDCNSNIQSTAASDRATRKVNYTCNQNITNCNWRELTP